MPVYELEILEEGGWVVRGEHASPAGVRYDVGDAFEHEGRMLRVKLLEETELPFVPPSGASLPPTVGAEIGPVSRCGSAAPWIASSR
jgi:hypothetical protein